MSGCVAFALAAFVALLFIVNGCVLVSVVVILRFVVSRSLVWYDYFVMGSSATAVRLITHGFKMIRKAIPLVHITSK